MRRLVICAVIAVGLALTITTPALGWSWPLQGNVLRPFALGADPYAGGQHRGVDVEGAAGEAVRAPAGGTVTFAGSVPTHGRVVTILTSDGYAVTLAHLGELAATKGEVVAEGDRVGEAGASGTPEHPGVYVHLGVRVAAQDHGYVDPLSFLPARPVVTRSAPAVQAPGVPQAAAAAPATPPAAPAAPAPSSPAPSAAAGSGYPQQTVSQPTQGPVPAPASTTASPTAPLAPGGVTLPAPQVGTALEQDPSQRRTAPASGGPATSPRRAAPTADAPSGGGQLHAGSPATPGVIAVATQGPATRSHAQPAGGPAASDAGSRLTLPAGLLAADRGDGGTGVGGGAAPAVAVAPESRDVRAARTAAAAAGPAVAAAAPHGSRVSFPGAEIEPPPVGALSGLRAARSVGHRGAHDSGRAVPSEPVLGDGAATAGAGAGVAGDGTTAWLVGAGAAALLLALVGLVVVARRAATMPVLLRGGAWARA